MLVKINNLFYPEDVKNFVTILALTGFLFSSVFENTDLENLSTMIHITNHQSDVSSAHDEEYHHTEAEKHHHGNQNHTQKSKKNSRLSITHYHKESSNSEPKNNEPHEHNLTISPNFVAFVVDTDTFDYSEIKQTGLLIPEPNQLISGLYKNPLFRPPIA